ncbi:MAG: TolC family outer membrane protein [Gammaproteobacteria bacterium]|nr:TolC family outer membrane protein [Gammaproteobacteria bacterium]MCH9743646.1 TolC family outer membrane protein [Gammaproteobacteria bacterium]
MKIRYTIASIVVSLFALGISASVQADDLLQVYNQAVHNDPTFKKAEADWYTTRENLPIARAAYLPLLELTGTFSRNYAKTMPRAAATDKYNWTTGYTATLTQPIFDMVAWETIRGAHAQVKSATATYLAAIQDLMERTANDYFDVLQASDKLRYTIANKNAVYRQLVTAEQQFKVGLIAITGVYDAQSRYDQTVADEISDRNSLYNALEDLRAITGQHYLNLKGIDNEVPLVQPKPTDINQWVHTAEMQNYALKAQNYTVIAARENIKQQASGALPTIDAVGSYSYSKSSRNEVTGPILTGSAAASAGLSLDFKPFQGGLVWANTAQARYQYLSSVSQLELTHRTVVQDTRKSYLGITSGISRIKADKQSIQSSQKALKATEAGYVVGTRTMVNVLDDLTTLYKTQQSFADDQYAYIESIIDLKEQAGTLGFSDLQQIDSWLKRQVNFDVKKNIYKPITQPTRSRTKKVRPQHRLRKSSGRYVIQIYAARNINDAKRFVSRNNPYLSNMRIVKREKWYKVLYGNFASRAAAKKAITLLPSNVRINDPWVTSVSGKLAAKKHSAYRMPRPKPRLKRSAPALEKDGARPLPRPVQLQLPNPDSTE